MNQKNKKTKFIKNYFFKTNQIFFVIFTVFILFNSCKKEENKIEPITFSFFSSDLSEPEYFTDLIAKEIINRTGVNLEFEYSVLNQTDAILLMLANDSFPDLIYAKGDLVKLIEEKAVIPLDDYIEKYGDNIKKLYGNQIAKLRNTLDDPYIYSVGTYEIKTKTMETSGNIQLQNAVLKEFGYPKIKTLDDLENILKAYIKKYPVINGHKTIGLSLLTDSWYWYLGLANPGNYVIGYPDDGQWIVNQETLKATYKFLHPEMKLFYKWLNKIYHEGLLDPESFTQDLNLWNSKLKAGYVLSTSYPLWALKEIKTDLILNGLEDRTFAYLPVTLNENYKDPSLKDYGFSGGWGIAITKDCKDPVRAFKFLDWICSEEAQILINWGIQDKHYYYDWLGRRTSFENINPDDGVGKWTYPFPQAGAGMIDSGGNPIAKQNKDTIIKDYCATEKETLAAYGAEIWTDLFPTAEELGISRHGQVWQYPLNSQLTDKVTQADELVKNRLIKMILGDETDFDSQWNLMTENLIDMGIKKVEDEVTKLIQMKIQLWNN